MRKWIIPLAVMMVVPALGAAAPIVQPPEPERLVEGHTVFTVISQVNATTENVLEFAAAVAVLVREVHRTEINIRFPGVLWFNDQYLVNPVNDSVEQNRIRYPCTGAVLAVNSGGSDPRTAFVPLAGPVIGNDYQESYQIIDPNDQEWTVDKWSWASGLGTETIWTVAIMNDQLGYNVPDDGESSCAPVDEAESPAGLPCMTGGSGNMGGIPFSPGGIASPGRCEDDSYITTNGAAARYNAVLFFYTRDLTAAGGDKDHSVPSTDVSGCHDDPNPYFDKYWPCPSGDDHAEGNSHPYNPWDDTSLSPHVNMTACPNCAGAGNHGGSGAGGAQHVHATFDIDVYYGTAAAPLLREFVLVDTQGSLAPYHCDERAPVFCTDHGALQGDLN